jgi:hypothetical protein
VIGGHRVFEDKGYMTTGGLLQNGVEEWEDSKRTKRHEERRGRREEGRSIGE